MCLRKNVSDIIFYTFLSPGGDTVWVAAVGGEDDWVMVMEEVMQKTLP